VLYDFLCSFGMPLPSLDHKTLLALLENILHY
jgi:hypothetical protein